MKWTKDRMPYQGPAEGDFGFVYQVRCIDRNSEYYGWWYIGCKSFYSVTNPKISAKRALELYSGKGAKKKRERKVKESNWKSYCTSNKELQVLVKEIGVESFSWEILGEYKNKSDLHLAEAKEIINRGCLCDPMCFNNWISIKVQRSNLNCNK